MITAIVFDFGRVISAQKPPYLFQGCEEELGLAPDTINQIMFASRDWQEALQGRKTLAQFWQAIGTELGLNAPGEIDDFRRRYRADEEVNESVLDLIRRLYDQYKLAVLSNYLSGLTQWLADWRILDFFDVVFCSGDEGVVKPDPSAFQMTLERPGVMPEEAVFIDDTLEHVEAARKLGLHGVLFTTADALEKELGRLLGRDF